MSGTRPVLVRNLADLPAESFDYIIGTGILCHNRHAENLRKILRLLKPGEQILLHFDPDLTRQDAIQNAMIKALRGCPRRVKLFVFGAKVWSVP